MGKSAMDESDDSDEDEQMITRKQFEYCFNKIDGDNTGSITKDEMFDFIKEVTGL